MLNEISTGLGNFSKEKFNALVQIRGVMLGTIRDCLTKQGYTEVSTSSLVNIAGSCENPYASFTLNYYGGQAHLSQSSQLQLEALVIRLGRAVYTVNSSFREENFDDPTAHGRRLSEFTLVEPEKPYFGLSPNEILNQIMDEQEIIIKKILETVLHSCRNSLKILGADINYLESIRNRRFIRISYDDALSILNHSTDSYKFGDDLGIREERALLASFDSTPVFVTHYPAAIKFFNMKRTPDGQRVFNAHLLVPKLEE